MDEQQIEILWTANGVLVMPHRGQSNYAPLDWAKCYVFNDLAGFQKHMRTWWKEFESE